MRIVLAGMVAGDPHQGGATWAVLQYLLGLRDLGHEVLLVEPVQSEGEAFPAAAETYFGALSPLLGEAALLDEESGRTAGTGMDRLVEFCRSADLLINVSGMLSHEDLLGPIERRLFLDLDPGFNQIWAETGADMGFERHTHFATVGQLVGTAECPVPTGGRKWLRTLPPVLLSRWPAAASAGDAYTSVGHWRSYGPIEYGGLHLGQRAHSMRELIDLPGRVGAPLRMALGIHPGDGQDISRLESHGWELVDPHVAAGSPDDYARFIRGSRGELSVAKSGYVEARTGWVSDRSACYLASGRPVIAQDTGFSEVLPHGRGLLAYETAEDAAAAIAEVERDWSRHSGWARGLAEELLDSRRVLPDLLDAVTSGVGRG